jgi:inward rectifier potassium channel
MSKIRRAIDRMKAGEDLGIDRTAQKGRQRTINADGTYNMERKTGRLLGNFYLYHWLITASWRHYWLVVFGFYGVMNVIFATVYYAVGVDQLSGAEGATPAIRLMHCFFFSAQSFTTVGYGGIFPVGRMANFIATLEAFTGLMTFALATGTLYGRFSRPVSQIKYSKNIIISPYKDITGLQFMVANEMSSTLMEMEARVNIGWFEDDGTGTGSMMRRFQQVHLEIDKIALFPTSWILNHPIDEESILYGRSMEEIKKLDIEVYVLLKGFDDIFSQTIYSRHSYMAVDFIYGAKFRKPWIINTEGRIVMDLTKVGNYDLVELPVPEMA